MSVFPLNHGSLLASDPGSVQFDGVDDNYELDSLSVFTTYPEAPWALWFTSAVSDNAGTAYQYAISKQNVAANDSLNIFLYESSTAGQQDRWQARIKDSFGTEFSLFGPTIPVNGTVYLILLQRTATHMQFWSCIRGQAPILGQEAALGAFGRFSAGHVMYIGKRADSDVDRYYSSLLSGVGRASSALNETQMKLLAQGISPHAVVGAALSGYIPLGSPGLTQENTVNPGEPATGSAGGIGAAGAGLGNFSNPLLHRLVIP